jgi:hypothetical protein
MMVESAMQRLIQTLWMKFNRNPVSGLGDGNTMNPESRDSSVGIATGNEWPARNTDKLTDCLENVAASASHNRMGLHGLLQG